MASFTDANPGSHLSDFSSTPVITWGDGQTSNGTLSYSGGTYSITGSHTYAEKGSFAATVAITDVDGNTANPGSTITVDDAALTPVAVTVAPQLEGAALNNVVIASFTDANPGDHIGDFSASLITWGDGNTSAGTLHYIGSNTYTITGSHTYSDEGSFASTVAITDVDGNTANLGSTITVNDAALVATGQSISTVEGGLFNAAVATFTDANPGNNTGDFTATINWGDTSSSAGAISYANGTYTVSGSHTYADEGSHPVNITINDIGGQQAVAFSQMTIADAALVATGQSVSAVEGALFNNTVATFTDANPGNHTGDFTATINWGDSSTAQGVISFANGTYTVSGSHTYVDEGSHPVNVTINDLGGQQAVASSLATISDAALAATGQSVSAVEGALFNGAVATFTDANPGNHTGDFTATITWGDSSSSAGVISFNNGTYTVNGSHTYADEGSHPVNVTINDLGGQQAFASNQATIADATLAASGQSVSAVEGALFNGAVATFTDANPGNHSGDFTATITWGDSFSSGGVISFSNGTYTVSGSHTYADEGGHPINITINDIGGQQATAIGQATITDAALASAGRNVSAIEGILFNGAVATFTDANPGNHTGDFTATINWGDNIASAGTLSFSNGTYTVNGSHIYADEGSHPVGVIINDVGGQQSSASSQATITDAALAAAGQNVSTVEGALFNGTVATFTDVNPGSHIGDFTATINWGDNSSSGGFISFSNGTYSVNGSHVYADEGSHQVSVSINDIGSSHATALSLATISDANLIATGQDVLAIEANPFSGPVASFSDANLNAPATDFTAVINWGDGHFSNGTITANGNGNFTVKGVHTYAFIGTDPISVVITDIGGAQATASSSATVTPASLTSSSQNIFTTEGMVYNAQVANFVEGNLSAVVGNFVANVNWGDGQITTDVISGGNGHFTVNGSHIYSEEGSHTISVAIDDIVDSAHTSTAATVTIADAPIAVSGNNIVASRGTTYNGVIATFSDADIHAPIGDYVANINWGDGITSQGIIVPNGNGNYTVTGSHSFALSGSDALTVTIVDVGGSTNLSTHIATVNGLNITPPPQVITPSIDNGNKNSQNTVEILIPPGEVLAAAANTPLAAQNLINQLSHNSIDAILYGGNQWFATRSVNFEIATVEAALDDMVSIHNSFLSLEQNLNNQIEIVSETGNVLVESPSIAPVEHLTNENNYAITQIESAPNNNLVFDMFFSAAVALAMAKSNIFYIKGSTFNGPVATFTYPAKGANVNDFKSIIEWGDGETSIGIIQSTGDGNFVVNGDHTYPDNKSYNVKIDIQGPGGFNTKAGNAIIINDKAELYKPDVEGISMAAKLLSGPKNGSLGFHMDGSLFYNPNAEFGADFFRIWNKQI